MRLTLRVLMAYLDDVLTPQQIREVGQQIQESNVARTLIERIRTQMKRRRISAIDALEDDPDFTAQEVAAYLNNEMPAEQVAEFEHKCLQADQRLVEVAGSHQILSLVVGEPVTVPETTRKRMYDLIDSHPQLINSELITDPPSNHEMRVRAVDTQQSGIVQPPHVEASQTDQSDPSVTLADYQLDPLAQKKSSTGLWTILVLIAVLVWGGFILSDSSIWSGFVAQNVLEPTEEQLANFNDQAVAEDSPKADATDHAASPVTTDPQPQQAAIDPEPVIDPEKVAALPEDLQGLPELAMLDQKQKTPQQIRDTLEQISPSENTKPVAPRPATTEKTEPPTTMSGKMASAPSPATSPEGTTIAKVDLPPMQTSPAPKTEQKPQQPQPIAPKPERKLPFPEMVIKRADQLLILDQLADDQGHLVEAEQTMKAQELLVIPPLNEVVIETGDQNFQVLAREESAVVFSPQKGELGKQLPAIQLNHGRLVLQFSPALWKGLDAEQKASFTVLYNQNTYPVEITTPEISVVVGISIANEYDSLQPARLKVQVSSGEVRLPLPEEKFVDVKAGESVVVQSPETNDPQTTPADVVSSLEPWAVFELRTFSLNQRRQHNTFLKEMNGIHSVWFDLEALAASQQPIVSEISVKTLGLGDQLNGLVASLIVSSHEESHDAAVKGIRSILSTTPERQSEFEETLQGYFPQTEVNIIMKLMAGFPPETASDPAMSQQFVDLLSHEQVVIRELTIEIIEQMTGRRYDFRPHAPLSYRIPAVGRWQQHIDREGALVQPEADE